LTAKVGSTKGEGCLLDLGFEQLDDSRLEARRSGLLDQRLELGDPPPQRELLRGTDGVRGDEALQHLRRDLSPTPGLDEALQSGHVPRDEEILPLGLQSQGRPTPLGMEREHSIEGRDAAPPGATLEQHRRLEEQQARRAVPGGLRGAGKQSVHTLELDLISRDILVAGFESKPRGPPELRPLLRESLVRELLGARLRGRDVLAIAKTGERYKQQAQHDNGSLHETPLPRSAEARP